MILQYNWNFTYLHTTLPNNGKVFRRLKPAGQRLIASNKTQSIQPQKIYPILHERTLFLLKNVWHIAKEIERFSSWQKRKRFPNAHLDMLMFELWTDFRFTLWFHGFCHKIRVLWEFGIGQLVKFVHTMKSRFKKDINLNLQIHIDKTFSLASRFFRFCT